MCEGIRGRNMRGVGQAWWGEGLCLEKVLGYDAKGEPASGEPSQSSHMLLPHFPLPVSLRQQCLGEQFQPSMWPQNLLKSWESQV